jgi:cell division septal protein FtsQ
LLNWLEEQDRIQALQDEVAKMVRRKMIWVKLALWPMAIIIVWVIIALSKEIDNGILSIILPIIFCCRRT